MKYDIFFALPDIRQQARGGTLLTTAFLLIKIVLVQHPQVRRYMVAHLARLVPLQSGLDPGSRCSLLQLGNISDRRYFTVIFILNTRLTEIDIIRVSSQKDILLCHTLWRPISLVSFNCIRGWLLVVILILVN